MADYIHLRRDLLDALDPVDAYKAAAGIDSQAKALQAAYRDEIVYRLAAEHGPSGAARILGIAPSTVVKHTNRHKERTMWTVPDTLPAREGDENGQAGQPTGHTWWAKTVHRDTAGPSRVYIMRGKDEWLAYECAGDPRTDAGQLAEGMHAAATVARLLAEQVPTLERVGREVGARTDGTEEGWRAAGPEWRPAIRAAWSNVKGVLPVSGLDKDIFARWAEDVMRGDQGGPQELL